MNKVIETLASVRSPIAVTVMGILLSFGVFLLGVAAVLVAAQWGTSRTTLVEASGFSSPKLDQPKLGYVTFDVWQKNAAYGKEAEQARSTLLLDKDTGRMWASNGNGNSYDKWKEVDVEGLTPIDSPARAR